jgi:pyruvate/2-oxoglutarate/acetoin dehydrogenase E1 component
MSSPTSSGRYRDAIREGIAAEMRADPTVILLGIDVGAGGGIYTVTRGLYDEFGPGRVRDTPISEMAFVGAAVGAAATGLRPVVELMYMDFLGVCFDALLNQAAKLRYMTGGQLKIPMVLRTQTGAGRSSGAQHSQSLEAVVAHIPGLKVVMPSSVQDAYVLMRSSIRDDSPVIYIENRQLYGRSGDIPTGVDGALPIGRARVVRPGGDVTVVTWSRMVEVALAAADQLAAAGVETEVIDLRSLVPLDIDTVVESVTKTGRAIVLHEAVSDFGPGAEIASQITERAFDALLAPVRRVGSPAVPMPFSPPLEKMVIPDVAAVVVVAQRLVDAGSRKTRRVEEVAP